jgi:hypothetical protein
MAEIDGNFKSNDLKLNITLSSVNTISEIRMTKTPFFKLLYVFFTFFNSILGFYLIFKFRHLLFSTDNINLFTYLLLYTFKWPLAFSVGVVLAFIIIIFKKIMTSEYSEENTPNYIGHIFVCSILNLVIIYFSSVFWSIYLIVKLLDKNSIQYRVNFREKFELIYIFLIINFTISFIIFSTFCYFLLMANLPIKAIPGRDHLDEEFIKKVKEEIDAVNRISGTLTLEKEEEFKKEHFMDDLKTKSQKDRKSENHLM